MKRFLKPLIALVMVVALVAPAVATAEAAPSRSRQSVQEQKVSTFMTDSIKLTQIKLSPTTKRFVNWILAATLPAICPIMGSLAAPELQAFVTDACKQLATVPDPWAALGEFIPLLRQNPGAIFPDYENLFVVACRFL